MFDISKKSAVICLICVICMQIHAQQPPEWTQSAHRESAYPAAEWYTGFAFNNLRAGENVATALSTLQQNALNAMTERIIVTVRSTSELTTTRQQRQSGGSTEEEINRDYRQAVQTATTATTVNTDVRTHYNAATGEIFAFAAVRRSELAAFYRRQLNVDLNRAETAVGVSEHLVEAGRKISAREKVMEARATLADVYSYIDMLAAVSATAADQSDLQLDRAGDLMRTVERLLIHLEQSTFVYIACSHEQRGGRNDAFSSDPGIFCDIIAQALTQNDCAITDSREEADFILTLVTSTTMRSDGVTGQFPILTYYANVRGTLFNRATNRQTASFTILNDADAYEEGRDPQDAATRAFNLPALRNKVLESILPRIRN